jgi:hypothetical protein
MVALNQVASVAGEVASSASQFVVGAVTSPDTWGEYAFLAAAGLAVGGAGYVAYKSWATSEPVQQLSRYAKYCPKGQLKYKSVHSGKVDCVDDRLIAGGFCNQRVFGNAQGVLYCADAPISKGDVEFTQQLKELYDAMRAAEVTDAERKEADKKVFEAQLDEINAKRSLQPNRKLKLLPTSRTVMLLCKPLPNRRARSPLILLCLSKNRRRSPLRLLMLAHPFRCS